MEAILEIWAALPDPVAALLILLLTFVAGALFCMALLLLAVGPIAILGVIGEAFEDAADIVRARTWRERLRYLKDFSMSVAGLLLIIVLLAVPVAVWTLIG